MNRFPEIQNVISHSRNVTNNWRSDYHERKGGSVVSKLHENRFKIATTDKDEVRVQYSLRQTFESTKAHSSVDTRSKQDWYQVGPAFVSQ